MFSSRIYFRIVALLLAFASINDKVDAQCCSPGNPVGGTTNIGIVDKKAFRLISFYRYSLSEDYWQGDKKTNKDLVKNGFFHFTGLTLAYGLTKKLTVETELGYFLSKKQTLNITPSFSYRGFGLSNAVLSFKYNLITKTERPFEWTVGMGAKLPMSTKYQMSNYVELPIDVQPSTFTYGIVVQSFLYKSFSKLNIKSFLTHRLETNAVDYKLYKLGNSFLTSLFFSKPIAHTNFTAIVQLRNELRSMDMYQVSQRGFAGFFTKGKLSTSTGGNLFFIAPQLNYTINKKWNLSLLAERPLYNYYNGKQLGNKMSFAVYLSRDFAQTKCEQPRKK